MKNSKLKNIKQKNVKGTKEKDHLFRDEELKIIYYAELKSNINLDTEKSKYTSHKCMQIVKELCEENIGYSVKWCLLGYRYLNQADIPSTIRKKYKNIDDNLYGINDYFKMLDIGIVFDEESYKKFLNNISKAMFKNF